MCIRRAEWTIVYSSRFEEVTEACTEHVGMLLSDSDLENHVYPIEIDNTEAVITMAVCCFSEDE